MAILGCLLVLGGLYVSERKTAKNMESAAA